MPGLPAQTQKSQLKNKKAAARQFHPEIPQIICASDFQVYITPASPFAGIRAMLRLNAGQRRVYIIDPCDILTLSQGQNPES